MKATTTYISISKTGECEYVNDGEEQELRWGKLKSRLSKERE